MGCAKAQEESWGEFGMGWRQIATSIDMSSPDNAVLIGQASLWSPATAGTVHANVVSVPFLTEEKAFDAWKGKLAGKALLYGKPPAIVPDPKPLLEHYDATKL
jgi:carboxypeptidase Q